MMVARPRGLRGAVGAVILVTLLIISGLLVDPSTGPRSPPLGTGNTGALPAVSAPAWTNLTAAPSPPARDWASMTYDPSDHSILLFGGLSSAAYPTNDTWEFSNGVWQNVTAVAGTPPLARYGMAMTYDAADGYVLAFGGTAFTTCPSGTGEICNDTWSFSDGEWQSIPAQGAPAQTATNLENSLVYDAAGSYVVLTNGYGTWEYRAGVWSPFCFSPGNCTRFTPEPDLQGVAAYDAHDGYVLFFGGVYDQNLGYDVGNYTWKFAGGNWTNITSTAGAAPSSRIAPMLTSDSATGGALLFGGYGPGYPTDTWSFQNGTWHNLSSTPSPVGRYAGALADYPVDSVVVLFGGDRQLGNAGNLNDTWVWGVNPPIAGLIIHATPSVPLPGSSVSFTASFLGGTGPFSYSWTFGDGGSSASAAPSHTYENIGYYTTHLQVTDSVGYVQNASLQIHVYTPLTVTILSVTPNPATLGQIVNFTASATGGTPPYTYSWSFGDGGVGGNLSAISHIYTSNGPFLAQVAVVDSIGGISHASINVSIRLQALVGVSSSSITPPYTFTFIGEGQGGTPPYSYEWTFGDGSNSTVQDPTHTYASVGEFTVTLTVVDHRGNRSVSTLLIQAGFPIVGGPPMPIWPAILVGILVGSLIIVVAVVAVILVIRQRSLRKEGERWIEEIVSEEAPTEPTPHR